MRAVAFAGMREIRHVPYRVVVPAVAVLVFAVACGLWRVAGVAFAVTAGACTWWLLRHVAPPSSTKAWLARENERQQRSNGTASMLDVLEHASPAALRRDAPVLRPALAAVPAAKRRRLDPRELGVCLVKTGFGLLPGQQVWSSCEDVTLRLGGPRTGKTLSLARYGLHAPGALVTTSTRLDLARCVQRARRNKPVHVINLGGFGKVKSTVHWSVLSGCKDYATAARRAEDMISTKHLHGDSLDWATKAKDLLSLLLHAAALGGFRARILMQWINAEGVDSPDAQRILALLASEPDGGSARAMLYRAHHREPDKTRGSVIATLTPALGWLKDDAARPVGDAETPTLDPRQLIIRGETLHLVGHETNGATTSVIMAIVMEIIYQARYISMDMPGDRLDPPLTMLLDELALICPIPFPELSADMGGRNITLHGSVQSIAQMEDKWGEKGANAALGNVGALLVFGGSKGAKDLKDLSTLTGESRVKVLDRDGRRDPEWRENRFVPLLTPGQISSLRKGQVLVLRRGLLPVIGRAPLIPRLRRWFPARLPTASTETAAAATVTPALPVPQPRVPVQEPPAWWGVSR